MLSFVIYFNSMICECVTQDMTEALIPVTEAEVE